MGEDHSLASSVWWGLDYSIIGHQVSVQILTEADFISPFSL